MTGFCYNLSRAEMSATSEDALRSTDEERGDEYRIRVDVLRSPREAGGNEYHIRRCTQIDGRGGGEMSTTSEWMHSDRRRKTGGEIRS